MEPIVVESSELDELMDALPQGLRDKVLKAWNKEPKPKYKVLLRTWVLMCSEFIFACVLTAVGMLLCVTIVGAPVGISLIVLGCLPLRRTVVRMVLARDFPNNKIVSRREKGHTTAVN